MSITQIFFIEAEPLSPEFINLQTLLFPKLSGSRFTVHGSKVVRFWYWSYCKTLIALATFTHLSVVQDFRLRESAEASAEEIGRRVGCSSFTAPIDALSLWYETVIVFQPWTVNAEPLNPGKKYLTLVWCQKILSSWEQSTSFPLSQGSGIKQLGWLSVN